MERWGSPLTAVWEAGGVLVLVSDWLVLVSEGQQCTAGGVACPAGGEAGPGRGGPPLLLLFPLRQKVTDLLLQLSTDVVLGQNQNPQAGWVVLHHVQEHLHTMDTHKHTYTVRTDTCWPTRLLPLECRAMIGLPEPTGC